MLLAEVAMSLEVLNTLGTLTTVIIVAATAVAALIQLRHLRASNQINAMLSIGEQFNAQTFKGALDLVNEKLDSALQDPTFRDYNVAFSRNLMPPETDQGYVDLRHATRVVANSYEELGVLIKNGVIDRPMFLDRYSWVIVGRWRNLEDFIALTREATGSDAIWENFEYLAVLSEDFINEHPSLYPKGVRRMQLRNPWPIASVPATA
jgi:hypothetical protein